MKYRESKLKRPALRKIMQEEELRKMEVHGSKEALKRFREVPYQLKYLERLRNYGK